MVPPQTVTVLGGGNAAFALAAALAVAGHEVRLCEAPEFRETVEPVRQRGGIELVGSGVPGIETGFAPLAYVGTDMRAALAGAATALLTVPAYAEARFGELMLDGVTEAHLVVFCCGSLGGALEFSRLLTRRHAPLPLVAEMESFIFSGAKSGPAGVRIAGRKAGLATAACRPSQTPQTLERLAPLFPDLRPARNALETGLRNLNLILHAPISLLNAGLASPHRPKFRYYWDGVTPEVGRAIEALDAERCSVARALGLDLPTALASLIEWYGAPGESPDSLAAMLTSNPVYQSITAPQTLEHRFLTEDVPFNMVPLESLAASLGVPTPVGSALITLASVLLGRDFRREGRPLHSTDSPE